LELKEIQCALTQILEQIAADATPNQLDDNRHFRSLQTLVSVVLEHFSDVRLQARIERQPQSLRQKMEQMRQDLAKIDADLNKLQQDNHSLLNLETSLKEKEKEHQETLERIQRLQNLMNHLDEIEQSGIGNLPIEEVIVEQRIRQLVPALEKLLSVIKQESNIVLDTLRENALKIRASLYSLEKEVGNEAVVLTENIETLRLNWDGEFRKYNAQVELHKAYTEKIEAIRQEVQGALTKHYQDFLTYTKHFEEDERIWGALGEPVAANQLIEQQLSDIKTRLQNLDTELLAPIKKKEKIFNA